MTEVSGIRYPNELTEHIYLDNVISRENFNKFVKSSGSTILKPWTLFKGTSDITIYNTIRLLNGSSLSQLRTTNVFYELLSLDIHNEDYKSGIVILEPLKDIENLELDSNGYYELNGLIITTNMFKYDKDFIYSSKGKLNPMFDGSKPASRIFTTWSDIMEYMFDEPNNSKELFVELARNFYSVISYNNIDTQDKDKNRVFKYAEETLKDVITGNPPTLREFTYVFDMRAVMVHVSVELDMRGIYTSADLNRINTILPMQIKPAWYSEDDEFITVLKENDLDTEINQYVQPDLQKNTEILSEKSKSVSAIKFGN